MTNETQTLELANKVAELEAKNRKLAADNENLRSVTIAAAEEIHAHWNAHCDADGYGPANLMSRLEQGIPAEYGYKAGAFRELTEKLGAAEKDASRYRYLRSMENAKPGDCWIVIFRSTYGANVGPTHGREADYAIDSAIASSKGAV